MVLNLSTPKICHFQPYVPSIEGKFCCWKRGKIHTQHPTLICKMGTGSEEGREGERERKKVEIDMSGLSDERDEIHEHFSNCKAIIIPPLSCFLPFDSHRPSLCV